jgi:hypothetical protein
MGIIYNNARLLCSAKQRGASFDKVLTVGHLELYLDQHQLRKLSEKLAIAVDCESMAKETYSDEFFKQFLGAKSVESIDYSDYQGSKIVHDLSYPIAPKFHGSFDAIIDGGTLEHIFNVPTALANYMDLVRVGGSVFIFTACNNHCGHGFYQFSPEFFFRAFNRDNGFEVCELIIDQHRFPGPELGGSGSCYTVTDPETAGTRVGLVSRAPVLIMLFATKTATKQVFAKYPIQSDYTAIYETQPLGSNRPRKSRIQRTLKSIFHSLPLAIQQRVIGIRQLGNDSLRNRQFFQEWNP